jgi:HSP90 family molecular chaperone
VAWWKEVLGSDVKEVRVTNRLATSPAMVVTAKFGWGANMERIMKAQVRLSPSLPSRCIVGWRFTEHSHMKQMSVAPRTASL